jgi:hypothetical protein
MMKFVEVFDVCEPRSQVAVSKLEVTAEVISELDHMTYPLAVGKATSSSRNLTGTRLASQIRFGIIVLLVSRRE